MPERIYRDVYDKSSWDRGPWDDEPDKVQWVDEATGLDCLIVRGPMGCWCGYVGVAPGHRFHGLHYNEIERYDEDYYPDVHGGLTFAGGCDEHAPEEAGICHIPFDGRPTNVWWLGFDCGHAFDVSPGLDARMRDIRAEIEAENPNLKRPTDGPFAEVYRDLSYVREQVTGLAAQIA
jgi:hypothetical protein